MNPLRRGSPAAIAMAGVAVVVFGALTIVAFTAGGASTAASPSAVTGTPTGTGGGADLFRAKGCVACHDGPDGASSDVDVGPNLNYLPAVASRRVAGLDAAAYVRQSIQEPQSFVVPGYEPGGDRMGLMPALGLTAGEVDALVAWLVR